VIKTLVTNVAGINAARGDQLTVDTMPFDGSIREDRPADPGAQNASPAGPNKGQWYQTLDPKLIAGGASGTVLIVCVGIWLALRGRGKGRRLEATERMPALPLPQATARQLATEVHNVALDPLTEEQKLIDSLKAPMLSATKNEALTKYLRQEVKKDPAVATQLLRTWLLEEEG
jgi:flagellar biosynthesis/type III secretory pathway M-ring protein FliF/YscJ